MYENSSTVLWEEVRGLGSSYCEVVVEFVEELLDVAPSLSIIDSE